MLALSASTTTLAVRLSSTGPPPAVGQPAYVVTEQYAVILPDITCPGDTCAPAQPAGGLVVACGGLIGLARRRPQRIA